MKKIVILCILVLSISCASQKKNSTNIQPTETHKLSDEYAFKISKILSDSRCPEGVTCVWAGEVELVLSIYKEGVFYKDEALIISFKNFPENKSILENYTSNKKIKSIEVLPIKKQGIVINIEDYSLKIIFEKN